MIIFMRQERSVIKTWRLLSAYCVSVYVSLFIVYLLDHCVLYTLSIAYYAQRVWHTWSKSHLNTDPLYQNSSKQKIAETKQISASRTFVALSVQHM